MAQKGPPIAYVTCLCPEAKIFQPYLWPSLLADPKKIFQAEVVTMHAQRPSGAISFIWGKPKLFGGPTCTDKSEDLLGLVQWLTGGPNGDENAETDCYGLVEMKIGNSIQDVLSDLITQGFADPLAIDGKKLGKNIQQQLLESMEHAKQISKERVMRAVRQTWANLQKQYELNKENGLGLYKPSTAERLCEFVLRDELAKQKALDDKLEQDLDETLKMSVGK